MTTVQIDKEIKHLSARGSEVMRAKITFLVASCLFSCALVCVLLAQQLSLRLLVVRGSGDRVKMLRGAPSPSVDLKKRLVIAFT